MDAYPTLSWRWLQQNNPDQQYPFFVVGPWGRKRSRVLSSLTHPLASTGKIFWWGLQEAQSPINAPERKIQHLLARPPWNALSPTAEEGTTLKNIPVVLLARWLSVHLTESPAPGRGQQDRFEKLLSSVSAPWVSLQELLKRWGTELSSRERHKLVQLQTTLTHKKQWTTKEKAQHVVLAGHPKDLAKCREESLLALWRFMGEARPHHEKADAGQPLLSVLEDVLPLFDNQLRQDLKTSLEEFVGYPDQHLLIATDQPTGWQSAQGPSQPSLWEQGTRIFLQAPPEKPTIKETPNVEQEQLVWVTLSSEESPSIVPVQLSDPSSP